MHGCRCDRCNVLGNKRRFASRSETPTTTGSQDIKCQPANREKAAHPRRDCRHDAGIDRHMGRDTLSVGGKTRRGCRLARRRFLLRSTCPASRGKTPASRWTRKASKWRPGVRRPARTAAAFRNCRKEHRETNSLLQGEPTNREHPLHLRVVASMAFTAPANAEREVSIEKARACRQAGRTAGIQSGDCLIVRASGFMSRWIRSRRLTACRI